MESIHINSRIQTLIDIESDFSDRVIPKGSVGIVIECYKNPEGYAVDIAIPDDTLAGGFTYENVILTPSQLVVLGDTQIYQPLSHSYNSRDFTVAEDTSKSSK